MSRPKPIPLKLGPSVIELLIPQRRPLLMVDFVASFLPGPIPELDGGRHVSMNEPFFEGHFPGMPVWPGAFTIEGLGQAATLLRVIATMYREVEAAGEDPRRALEGLRNLDRGFRLHPGYRAEDVPPLIRGLRDRAPQLAVGASVQMKFVRPVFPGCRLDYHVQWTDDHGDIMRFAVVASIEGEPVATGTVTGANVPRPNIPIE